MFNFLAGPFRVVFLHISWTFSIVDLGAVVPVEAPHLGVHDALVGGGKHLGRGHVFVAPCTAGPENVIT